jgi:hypothetical protein
MRPDHPPASDRGNQLPPTLAVTPEQFIAKWQAAELRERAAAQSHFNDLCELLDEPKPTDADPKGDWYCFERGAIFLYGEEIPWITTAQFA